MAADHGADAAGRRAWQMSIPEQCDVVIIGGGPGGSTAAALLSQRGYRVVLLDKVRHPRFTVGESLIPHFWKYTSVTGASSLIRDEQFIQKAGGTVVWNGTIRQIRFRDFGYTNPALHVERDRFDYLLLQHARAQGAQVFEEVAATAVAVRDDGAGVTYRATNDGAGGEIACRFVIDASGQAAVVAKQLGIRVIDESFRFMSVWGYFLDSRYVAADGRAYPFENLRAIPPTTFVTSIGDLGEWGWVWHIPMRESTSIGLVLPIEKMQSVKTQEGLEAYFLRTCYETPNLNRLLDRARYIPDSLHIIRDYSYRPTQLAGPGFFLVGDAAAFVDPIFSVGVVLAMYSAYLATWAIERSFRDPAKTNQNQAIYAQQLLGRLEVARSLALPRYTVAGDASGLARQSVQFESSLEQELMYVVSTVTTRSENFLDMAQKVDGQKITSDKYRVLERITF
jgi:flavin-dependent dehydrogenase